MRDYDHKKIESKWQKKWQDDEIYKIADEAKATSGSPKENFYTLVEFPYPSGNLHLGHWYAFAVPDIFARFKRMSGYNVLFPIGFDAFGLPAENAAIKRDLDPRDWTYDNITYMEGQLKSMGNMFDWSRKVVTSDPQYYQWTQWLFLKLFAKGLAYKKEASVNWCQSCQTVLANEQVVDEKCERCETVVSQKMLAQWFFKTTEYAERLLVDLNTLNWPEAIKESQRNWIGQSEGAEITFKIRGFENICEIQVFTTRADTLFGATYLVIAPEHKLIQSMVNSPKSIDNPEEIKKYLEETKNKNEIDRTDTKKEKTGVEIKGIKAINPATGEEIPIWIADYVLDNYGTGAIMAVPAHDERDFEFAKKFNLPIKQVVAEGPTWKYSGEQFLYTGNSGIIIESGEFNDLNPDQAREKITAKFGKTATTYKLHDWLLSRQRYWGCPIPVVYNPAGEPVPVPEEHLPWLLPQDVDLKPTGQSPLATSQELKKRTEKIFGQGFTPEYDTMDTFVDSSWYFSRYTDPDNNKEFASKVKMKAWLPVKRYSGGAEHTTMHLLYARFFHHALFDLGLVNEAEPFAERLNRGLILGPDGQKMSKSKGNIIDPDEQVAKVGSDTVKIYLAFIGPYNEVGQYPWDLGGIAGVRRFLEKIWHLQEKVGQTKTEEKEITKVLHQTIKKVGEDVELYKFNTAVSSLMKLVNQLEKASAINKKTFETLLIILAPFAPHLTEELWSRFAKASQDKEDNNKFSKSVHLQPWPTWDKGLVVEETVTIVVQINGKVRDSFETNQDISKEDAKAQAQARPKIKSWLEKGGVIKIIYVPRRLVNIVMK